MIAPDTAPLRLIEFLERHSLDAEFIVPGVPMPTVSLAAAAIGVSEAEILKTLVFKAEDGSFVVAIASGNDRLDRNRLAEAAGVRRLRQATPDDVMMVTGYPAGGVSPLGLPAHLTVIVDRTTAMLEHGYGGGGDESLLLRVRMADVIRCNSAIVADVREASCTAT